MGVREAICSGSEDFEKIVDWLYGKILNFLNSNRDFLEPYPGFKEDLRSEIVIILLEKREKLCSKANINLSYVLAAVRNAILDRYFRIKKLPIQIASEVNNGGEVMDIPENTGSISLLLSINAAEALEVVKSSLSESELEVFCFKLHSSISTEDNPFLKDRSPDAKYKAWSRLKGKLRDLLSPFNFSEEEFRYFASLAMSELCRKVR